MMACIFLGEDQFELLIDPIRHLLVKWLLGMVIPNKDSSYRIVDAEAMMSAA